LILSHGHHLNGCPLCSSLLRHQRRYSPHAGVFLNQAYRRLQPSGYCIGNGRTMVPPTATPTKLSRARKGAGKVRTMVHLRQTSDNGAPCGLKICCQPSLREGRKKERDSSEGEVNSTTVNRRRLRNTNKAGATLQERSRGTNAKSRRLRLLQLTRVRLTVVLLQAFVNTVIARYSIAKRSAVQRSRRLLDLYSHEY
jgi:hypothetical protein